MTAYLTSFVVLFVLWGLIFGITAEVSRYRRRRRVRR